MDAEKGWKTAQDVAAGVGGFVVPVLWFGMDWQGAAGTEARALQDRQVLFWVHLPFRSTVGVRRRREDAKNDLSWPLITH